VTAKSLTDCHRSFSYEDVTVRLLVKQGIGDDINSNSNGFRRIDPGPAHQTWSRSTLPCQKGRHLEITIGDLKMGNSFKQYVSDDDFRFALDGASLTIMDSRSWAD
jgi:hypothetical protein